VSYAGTHRWNAKTDATQNALVKALLDCRIQVYEIRKPCDLLLRFWWDRHQCFCWQTLEVKPEKADGTPKFRTDQPQQMEFLRLTDTPVACNLKQAIQGINRHHQLGIA